MSLLLLLSSSGIVYAQHFCGDYEMMAAITMGEKHLSCGMIMESTGCEDDSFQNDCCDNEYTKIDVDDRFAKSDFEVDLYNNFIPAFTSVFVFQLADITTAQKPTFKDYQPPPIERDLLVLYETFLI
jgi:hypothetical protein